MDERYFDVTWLNNIADYRDPVELNNHGFVRTVHIGNKRDGCYLCGRKAHLTRHHIKKGLHPLAVYLCRRHHDIIHGTGLYRFKICDIRMVYCVATEYNLFKESEATIITKRLIGELEAREYGEKSTAWFGRTAYKI